MKNGYQKTIYACFLGYIVQAIVNNFVPLLFLTFQSTYDIPLAKITMLVTMNFGIQLIVDLFSAKFVDRIGYRVSILAAHICAAAGLILLTILPDLLSDSFIGILISVMIYAVGGGLIEVLISPIMESCPTDNKEQAMSLLHSFYCWGHMGVVLISTAFFALFGIQNWKIMMLLWALVQLFPQLFALMFTSDSELVSYASWALRIYMAATGIFGIQIACQQTFVALGNAKISLFLAVLRKIILLIPFIYILPNFFADKAFAVFLAEPVADFLAVCTTATMFAVHFKKSMTALEGKPGV